MSTQTSNNGRVRKTLASQLDRLEGILDTIGTDLPEAVSSAVEKAVGIAVKEAVQAVVVELLSSPALQEQLEKAAPARTAHIAEKKSLPGRLWAWISHKLQQAGRAVKGAALLLAGRLRRNGAAAAGAIGVLAYALRTRIASAVSTACSWGRDLARAAGSALGRAVPGLACCSS